jgi:diguanylate cyclase (GGDEF)-like protein
MFTFSFRVLMEGRPNHVQVRAAMVEEKDGARLIVGVNDVDTQVRQEEEAEKRLILAQSLAKIDALTGVKNKHAYLEAESQLNLQIAQHCALPFAVVMMDMNDLKTINDTAGHQAGDQSLRRACKIICDTFKHSPVFRIGGDEFAVIARGHDYIHLEELLEKMKEHNAHALRCGDIVIACGMARFDHDASVAEVFHRSDLSMYENKNQLKAGAKAAGNSLPKTTV